jgi:hypothetical protein
LPALMRESMLDFVFFVKIEKQIQSSMTQAEFTFG